MLDRLARNDHVKRIVGVRQILRVGLRQRQAISRLRLAAPAFLVSDPQRHAGKIGPKHARAAGSQKPGKTAAAAGHFQHAFPRAAGKYSFTSLYQGLLFVMILGPRLENPLMPIVVFSRELICPPAKYFPRERAPS